MTTPPTANTTAAHPKLTTLTFTLFASVNCSTRGTTAGPAAIISDDPPASRGRWPATPRSRSAGDPSSAACLSRPAGTRVLQVIIDECVARTQDDHFALGLAVLRATATGNGGRTASSPRVKAPSLEPLRRASTSRSTSFSAQVLVAPLGTSRMGVTVTPSGSLAAVCTGQTLFISIRRERSGRPIG